MSLAEAAIRLASDCRLLFLRTILSGLYASLVRNATQRQAWQFRLLFLRLFCINIESNSALHVAANIRKLFRIVKIPKISNCFKTCVSVHDIAAIVVLTFLRMSE